MKEMKEIDDTVVYAIAIYFVIFVITWIVKGNLGFLKTGAMWVSALLSIAIARWIIQIKKDLKNKEQ